MVQKTAEPKQHKRVARSLNVPHRFALSGDSHRDTNLEELWSLFEMIMPGFFPNKQRYRELTTQEIAKMIKPFIGCDAIQKSVLQDLPVRR